ncbi:MAG: hypothetical protein Q8Q05_00830 [bacterium]|nr:hypothetical protein [bacterium]
MRYVLTLLGCFLAVMSIAQGQSFTEDELRSVAKELLQVTWELGKESKSRLVDTKEIEKAIEKYLHGKPLRADKESQDLYEVRRVLTIDFAKWLIGISARAEDYALKPFLGIRLATEKDSPVYKDCVIWKISLPAINEKYTWLFVFEDSEKTEVNDTGQRIPKVVTIVRIPSNAPATAGARS